MFVVETGAELSATIGEVCYSGEPYELPAQLGGRTIARGDAPRRPAFLNGSALPLLRAGGNGPAAR